MNRNFPLSLGTACMVALFANSCATPTHEGGKEVHAAAAHPSVNADEAWKRLMAGNERFATATVTRGKRTAAAREATKSSQHPFALVVGCMDSRTAPELIFDQNIGDIFSVRTAGNLVDDHAIGSIEYAVNHGVRLIVVLAHERCGAVDAAMKSSNLPTKGLNSLVRDLQPAVKRAKAQDGDTWRHAAEANARLMAEKIQREAKYDKSVNAKDVTIIPAIYDLNDDNDPGHNGRVTRLD